jgi:NAD(P)-dependent dehydrogenase (short-subunit alcohol dehydrogenase family)
MAGSVVVIGGTSGLGREVAAHYAAAGRDVVLTGTNADRAAAVAAEIGSGARGLPLDLSQPETIAAGLAEVGPIDHLVLAAIARDHNTTADYSLPGAVALMTLKLVGYTEVVHTLLPRISADGSIVIFGGQALNRPYPGSTTVSTVNGGVIGLVHTLAAELGPIRVNGLHPGIVGDSPYWAARPPEVLAAVAARTPTKRLVTMADITGAVVFLLENPGINGQNVAVDGGWLLL